VRRRGFTYVEMTVIVLILFLFAAEIMPNLVRQKESRDIWAFKTRLSALALKARSRAIETGNVVALYYAKDPAAVRIVMEGRQGEQMELQSLAVPDKVKATKFDTNKDEALGNEWRLPFYPDGGTSGGGVQFEWEGATFCLSISKAEAKPRILEGPLPELELETWPAGGYAPRSS
jgi:Tfp pilus assembly protein FimT